MERKGYQLFSSMLKVFLLQWNEKKGTSVVTTTRLVVCTSLSCVYFCNCFVTWNLQQQIDLTASLSHLYWVSHYTFYHLRFYAENLFLWFSVNFSCFFSPLSNGFFFESVVSNYLVSMPARLICCVMSQIFEEVHDWKCLYLKRKMSDFKSSNISQIVKFLWNLR